MQFNIRGQDFFLTFIEQEKRWYLFVPSPQGIRRIPVYEDAVQYRNQGIPDVNAHLPS